MQGETAASHDVTSNVERSKHLDNPQEAKIYDAEVSSQLQLAYQSQSALQVTAACIKKTWPCSLAGAI